MMLSLWHAGLPVIETTAPTVLVEQVSAVSWPLLLALAILGVVLIAFGYGLFLQHKAIKLLTKECRRVSSVSVGMGQHILAIEKHVTGLGQDAQQHAQQQHDELVTKARDLLISGASIDEVTQYSGLSHAEVSLISSLTKSSNVNNVHPLNNFNLR